MSVLTVNPGECEQGAGPYAGTVAGSKGCCQPRALRVLAKVAPTSPDIFSLEKKERRATQHTCQPPPLSGQPHTIWLGIHLQQAMHTKTPTQIITPKQEIIRCLKRGKR